MSILINVNDLKKSYGSHHVLNGVSLQIEKSTIYGLVGLNGAGKTTLMRILLGILKPDSGSVRVIENDPWNHDAKFYSRLGVVLDHDGFWGNLTIKENLKIFSDAKQLKWTDTEKYLNEFWRDTVISSINKKVKNLSRGQRVQCALCRAFLGWPDVLLLDEPAVALDMTAYNHFSGMVRIAKARGASVVISSHQLDTIDDLCDRVGNLRDGLLADLNCNASSSDVKWILLTDASSDCTDLLLSCGCKDIDNVRGRWTFSIDLPYNNIPVIVKKMVESQFPLYEIRSELSGFSDTIRSIYRQNGSNVRITK